jgi:hypothetical protein
MFSKLVRRVHLYLGLFLTPWIAMYALSTIAMNHRDSFGKEPPLFEIESERKFEGVLPESDHLASARILLASLSLEGAHTVRRAMDGTLTIQRLDPVAPRRITYRPGSKLLRIERQAFHTNQFLERMHRKRGYQQDYLTDDLWAATVDLTIAAIVLWALTGLWMWWELKAARALGAVIAAAGAALFAFYLGAL